MAIVPRGKRSATLSGQRAVVPSITPSVSINTDIPIEAVGGGREAGGGAAALRSNQEVAMKAFQNQRNDARYAAIMRIDSASISNATDLWKESQLRELHDANGVAPEMLARMRDYHQKALLNIDDDKLRDMAERYFIKRETEFNSDMQKYEFAQTQQAMDVDEAGYLGGLSDEAKRRWQDPNAVRGNLDKGIEAILINANRKGLISADGTRSPQVDMMVQQFTSDVHSDIISTMVNRGMDLAADRYLKSNKKEMTADDIRRAEKSVGESSLRQQAFNQAVAIRAKFPGDIGKQRDAAKDLGKDNAKLYERVNSLINSMYAEDKHAEAEASDKLFKSVIEDVKNTPGFGSAIRAGLPLSREELWNFVDPEKWSQLTHKQKETLYKVFNPPQETKMGTFRKFMELVAKGGKELADMTEEQVWEKFFSDFRPEDARSGYNVWIRAREGLRQDASVAKKKAWETLAATSKEIGMAIDRGMVAKKLADNPEKMSAREKDQKASLVYHMESWVKHFEIKEKRSPITSEVEQEVDRYLNRDILDKRGWDSMHSIGEFTRKELLEYDYGERFEIDISELSDMDKIIIEARLSESLPGVVLTDELREEAYWHLFVITGVEGEQGYDEFIQAEVDLIEKGILPQYRGGRGVGDEPPVVGSPEEYKHRLNR